LAWRRTSGHQKVRGEKRLPRTRVAPPERVERRARMEAEEW